MPGFQAFARRTSRLLAVAAHNLVPVKKMLVAAVVLSLLAGVWLIAAPAIGFIRLVSARGIGLTSPAA